MTEPKVKVVIYLRVSSSEQTADNQLPALEKWIADKSHELVEVYQDSESAWRSGHQRELSKLFDDLKRRLRNKCVCHEARNSRTWACDFVHRWSSVVGGNLTHFHRPRTLTN